MTNVQRLRNAEKSGQILLNKRGRWEPTRYSSICSRHFTENDFARRFKFVDEVAKKPFLPRLKRHEIGVNIVPSIHAEAVTTKVVISERAKRRIKRVVRIVNCFAELFHLCKRLKKSF